MLNIEKKKESAPEYGDTTPPMRGILKAPGIETNPSERNQSVYGIS